MSLGVALGYPMAVCSQIFRVYRHACVMYRRLVRNARKSPSPLELKLSLHHHIGEAIYSAAADAHNSPSL